MITFLILILIVVCIILIVIVLMQSSKGSGLVGSAFGSGVTSMFGARRTSGFLSKTTIVLSVIFLLSSLLINLYISKSGGPTESIIQKKSGTQEFPPQTVPPLQQQQTPTNNQNQGTPENNTGNGNQPKNQNP